MCCKRESRSCADPSARLQTLSSADVCELSRRSFWLDFPAAPQSSACAERFGRGCAKFRAKTSCRIYLRPPQSAHTCRNVSLSVHQSRTHPIIALSCTLLEAGTSEPTPKGLPSTPPSVAGPDPRPLALPEGRVAAAPPRRRACPRSRAGRGAASAAAAQRRCPWSPAWSSCPRPSLPSAPPRPVARADPRTQYVQGYQGCMDDRPRVANKKFAGLPKLLHGHWEPRGGLIWSLSRVPIHNLHMCAIVGFQPR